MKSLTRLPLLLLLCISPILQSAPKVVASIPPIHSLVSGLMEGIAEPVLLVNGEDRLEHPLTLTQKLQLVGADMVVWVGPGLEKGVAKSVQEDLSGIQQNMYALSNYVPLLPREQIDLNQVLMPQDRQKNRDLTFWMDPKLAVMAVRRLTLKLALLDPQHTQQYLENEIRMVSRIESTGGKLAQILAPYRGSEVEAALAPTYMAWRYGLKPVDRPVDTLTAKSDSCRYLLRTDSGTDSALEYHSIFGGHLVPGKALYFQLLERHGEALSRCVDKKRTASREPGATAHSS